MLHVQITTQKGTNIQALIREAIADGSIKSFEVKRVKGGLRIIHKRYQGQILLTKTRGPILATVIVKNRDKEWQIFEAFLGRLAYHFKNEILGINIQFEPDI